MVIFVFIPLGKLYCIDAFQRLELDDFYGEGRYPYNTWRREPMWKFSQQHRDYVFRRHPYRNHDDVKVSVRALF